MKKVQPTETVARLKRKIIGLNQRNADLETKVKGATAPIIVEASAELTRVRADHDRANNRVNTLNAEKKELEQKLKAANEEIQKHKSTIEDLKKK